MTASSVALGFKIYRGAGIGDEREGFVDGAADDNEGFVLVVAATASTIRGPFVLEMEEDGRGVGLEVEEEGGEDGGGEE